ncbi:MAG: glucosamine--fructose-6-phosphate aminotransferase [Chloroflexi bacterium]|nr:MAG: glucosamine--fructose-6-phosphate aminotransferase [Chloroflexota bacterium]
MSYTYREIQQQPQSWAQTMSATVEQWQQIAQSIAIRPNTHFLCIGSGTSLYLAQSAAQALQEVTQHVAVAIPSSEVFLSPASTVPADVPVVAFVISRSGTTSEALMAADYLRHHCSNVTVIGITCNHATDLSQRAQHVITLPHAREQSVVMTQSYTSMLLALQIVAALIVGNAALLNELATLPHILQEQLSAFEAAARNIGQNLALHDFIYLGLGPNYGLAQEATLKLKEMTQTPCEAYNPLEFRHGPISIVSPGTAVVLLAGLREQSYIQDVAADVKQHGAYVVTIAPYYSPAADVYLSLPEGLSDIARCALYLPPVQLIAYYRALALQLNPDQPRNLSQVVVLHAS